MTNIEMIDPSPKTKGNKIKIPRRVMKTRF